MSDASVVVNDSATGKTPLNKVISLGLMAFAVVEAIISYFLVLGPLYVKPVYNQAAAYKEQGINCIVKLFGKTFASDAELAQNQIILSLLDTVVNIVLIYIIMTGIVLLLCYCFYKGFSFAKGFLTWMFGLKAIVGLIPMMIPFAQMRNSIRIFGAVDAVICLVVCAYFVYIDSVEYSDDMLFTDEQNKEMLKRGKNGCVMFGLMALTAVFEAFAMGCFGGSWSIYLGWMKDTSIAQGVVLAILAAVGLVGAITYVREADWAEYFFFSFGAAITVTNLIGIINRVMWIFRTYMPYKKLRAAGDAAAEEWFLAGNGMTTRWFINTVFLVLAFAAAAALAIYAFTKIKNQFRLNFSADDKKAVIGVLVSVGSIVLSFILTVAATTLYDKQVYGALTLGAMDYMYFIVYGGVTLFLAVSLWGGYSFSKWATLALYLIVASANFENIFNAFAARKSFVASNPGMVGYNYIIAAVLFILALISCFGIIAGFAVKDVDNYLYQKRYS